MSYDRMDNLMDCLNKEAENCEKEKKELIEEFLESLKIIKRNVEKKVATPFGINYFIEKWEKRR